MPGLRAGCRNDARGNAGRQRGILSRPIAIALELLSELMHEKPGKFCEDCIAYGWNLRLKQFDNWRAYDNECHYCYRTIFPFSRIPIAALQPGVTAPGEFQGFGWLRKVN